MHGDRLDHIYRGSFKPSRKVGYRIVGREIRDSAGKVFIPRGVNVGGTTDANNGGWPDLTFDKAYGNGMVQWGCNTVRIVSYVSDRYSWSVRGRAVSGGGSVEQADKAVDDHTDRMTRHYLDMGMVVITEAHDLTSPNFNSDNVDSVIRFWRRYAERWKHDSRVWFNIANEPNMGTDAWLAFHHRACATVRATGASNIIVLDALNYAGDIGKAWDGAAQPYLYDPVIGLTFTMDYGNVLFSQHNYGGYAKYHTEPRVRAYIERMQSSNLPLIYGEVGYPTVPAHANTGSFDQERGAALSTYTAALDYGVGVLWWASNFNDSYKLVDRQQGMSAVNEFAEGVVLSEAGIAVKQYVQACNALNQS